ncbi:MAG: hypothetical protein IJ863_00360, partial [Spirochaetales bacterium]|nr:hypothetical protein [Spirochaetales bacterium]
MGVLSCCGHRLFDIFEELAGIPHGSGNTDRISSWCEQFAKAHGLRCVKDDHNNVIIFRPGSRGHEDCAPVILQAHLDMVCVHEDGYDIDMARQPVRLVTDGRTIRAYRTSLGADNLIGVSIILALLTDESLVHPPIEAVLTSDEETGMHGARALDYSLLKGKMVINLDSGSDGHFNVCCSGGLQTVSTLPIRRKPLGDGLTAVRVSISGLAGGHSANRINRCGANANVLIAEMIFSLSKRIPIHLCALEGGSAENVIAFSSSAVLAFPSNMENAFDGQLKALSDGIRQRFLKTDPMMEITVKRTDVPEQGV